MITLTWFSLLVLGNALKTKLSNTSRIRDAQNEYEHIKPFWVAFWVTMLLACLFPSALMSVEDHFFHQRSALLPVSYLCCVWPVSDITGPSSPRFVPCSPPVDSSFQHFSAQISSSNHVTEIPELAPLYNTVVSRHSCACTSCSTDAWARCAVQLTFSTHKFI